MMNAIKEYFRSCPAIATRAGKFSVNYLGADPLSYSIENVPGNPVVKTYVNGDCIKAKEFVLASRETFTADAVSQAKCADTYDAVCEWVEANNRARIFPKIPNGEALSMSVTSSGYLMEGHGKTARYQIQVRLEYFQPYKRE